MAIVKSIPSRKIISGNLINASEISIVSETEYVTSGESCIVVRNISKSLIVLHSKTTDHVVIKAMVPTTIKPDVGKIDEEYDEIVLDKFSCVEFRLVGGNWYILSSDGLKQD
jgi:hypothetical protein